MMTVAIQVLLCVFLLADFISARTDISEHGQTVIDIPTFSGAEATCGSPTTAPTTMPAAWIFRRQMDMSMSDSMSPETMTMIEGTQTVVEVVTMGTTGDMETTTLSTITPTMSMPAMSSDNHHHDIGAIVGGAVGGVAAVALVMTAFLFWRRRGEPKLDSTGEVFAVVQSESKPSLDSMRPHNANTVPTPFGSDWQAIYHATHFGGDLSTNSTQPPISSKQEAARQQRQKELELQMLRLQDEMATLGPGPGRGPSALLDPDRAEDARQMEMMKQQIALLQAQQQSSWAQGLTDEPPPGYTADVVNRVVIR